MSRQSAVATVLVVMTVCAVDLVIVSAALVGGLLLSMQQPELLIPMMALSPLLVWGAAWFSIKATAPVFDLTIEEAAPESARKRRDLRATVPAYGSSRF